jgi:hypothetical protein
MTRGYLVLALRPSPWTAGSLVDSGFETLNVLSCDFSSLSTKSNVKSVQNDGTDDQHDEHPGAQERRRDGPKTRARLNQNDDEDQKANRDSGQRNQQGP